MFYNCRSKSIARMNEMLSATLYPCMSIGILLYGGYCIGESFLHLADQSVFRLIKQVVTGVLFLILGSWGFKTAMQILRFESRQYVLSYEGISLCGYKKMIFIPWEEVHEVALYAYQATPSFLGQATQSCSQDYSLVYCVLLKPKPPAFEYKLIRSDFFAAKHYDSFAVIDCTEESKLLFDTYCPFGIPDRRWTQIRGFRK